MDNYELKVYAYYKAIYPDSVVLFRVGDDLVAFGEDVVLLHQRKGAAIAPDRFKIPFKDAMETLSELECPLYKIVEYRGKDKEFCLPDIDTLEREKEDDY